MGLWEDAQANRLPQDERDAQGQRDQAAVFEFIDAMNRLGIPPSTHRVWGSVSALRESTTVPIPNGSLVGWVVKFNPIWDRIGDSEDHAPVIVAPTGQMYDCQRQPVPGKRGLLRGGGYEDFVPTAGIPFSPEQYVTLPEVLRDVLTHYMRGETPKTYGW